MLATSTSQETNSGASCVREASAAALTRRAVAMSKPWREHESSALLEPLRYKLMPPILAKRHFHLPLQNRVGLSLLEALVAVVLVGATVALGYVQRDARAVTAAGSVSQLLWLPLFALIMYRSAVTALFGIAMERSMFWHGLFAALAAGYSVWHGVIALDAREGRVALDVFRAPLDAETRTYWTGAIAAGLMTLTITLSHATIRRAVPRLWLWSHHVLPLAAAVVAVLHGARAVLAAVALYVLDRLYGYVYEAHFRHNTSKTTCVARVVDASGTVRLSLPRMFSFSPGQYMGICIPAVAWFEWHTFTIASAPSDADVVFLIKKGGRWTSRLVAHVEKRCGGLGSDANVPLTALMHGPVGGIAIDWTSKRYNTFLVVAGGIGVTPATSFFRELASQARRGRPVRAARLVYVTRSTDQARAVLDVDAPEADTSADDVERAGGLQGFEISIFLTGGASVPVDADSGNCGVPGAVVTWTAGRPDLRGIFAEVARGAEADGQKRVGVLTCGPDPLVHEVTRLARRSSAAVSCDVHVEHFY
jgi:hypothetical protein